MIQLAVDLGSTNVKVIQYDHQWNEVEKVSYSVDYIRQESKVEFDAEQYFAQLLDAIQVCAKNVPISEELVITLTGQAESLVLTDQDGVPLRNAISWMDERGAEEAEEIALHFPEKDRIEKTGQLVLSTSWPAVKLLWLRKHENRIFEQAEHYFLLKDYIAFRLTGKAAGEYSIYSFTYYFDIFRLEYWEDMLEFCGIPRRKLPKLLEPCSNAGLMKGELGEQIGIQNTTYINIGAIDHFCGMIGVGNICHGIVSESTGTVLAAASIADRSLKAKRIPIHCGPFPDSYVYLQVCESGAMCLKWFKDQFLDDVSYADLEKLAGQIEPEDGPLFFPYLRDHSAPDYSAGTTGVFYGIKPEHGKVHFYRAVMEGIAMVLERSIEESGACQKIIATGGGAKSPLWLQIKADICERPVFVPEKEEAACLGAAIAGAVHNKQYKTYEDAIETAVKWKEIYNPVSSARYAQKKRNFWNIYSKLFT